MLFFFLDWMLMGFKQEFHQKNWWFRDCPLPCWTTRYFRSMQLGNLQNLGNSLKSLQWIPELIGSTIYRFESVLWWIYWSGYHGLPSKCWPISMKKLWNSHSWWFFSPKFQVSKCHKVSQKIITPTARYGTIPGLCEYTVAFIIVANAAVLLGPVVMTGQRPATESSPTTH